MFEGGAHYCLAVLRRSATTPLCLSIPSNTRSKSDTVSTAAFGCPGRRTRGGKVRTPLDGLYYHTMMSFPTPEIISLIRTLSLDARINMLRTQGSRKIEGSNLLNLSIDQ